MTLNDLISRLQTVAYDRRANLPYPNIYWVTIRATGQPQVDTYVAGAHTEAALQKAANWCAETHHFRPTRSTSTVRMRRLLLGDLVENPQAYYDALAKARQAGERDTADDLVAMPGKAWAAIAGAARPESRPEASKSASDDVWQRLCRDMDQHFLKYS